MARRRQEQERSDHKDERHAESRVSGPRPFWSGTITFGLVSLPVGLYPANRSKPVSLRMIDQDGTPLARRYFCEKEARTLTGDELIRGYEVERNAFVVVEDQELEELAPEKSQEIDLKRFVALSEIDPMYFERAYFLTPDKGITKAYRLLASSMEASGRAGIATFVMRDREYLVAIIAEKGILRAETLRFAAEVRSPAEIGLPAREVGESQRVGAFAKAIESLTTETLDRETLQDLHSQQILERVQKKLAKGEDVIDLPEDSETDNEQSGDVVDLMQVLKQSLEQGQSPADKAAGRTNEKAGNKSERQRSSSSTSAKQAPFRHKTNANELAELSKNELYQRAQGLGISGRSSMNKAQLIQAIKALA